MKTQNMTSTNGNKVANQFIINDDNGNTFFQSYKSIIVKLNGDDVELDQKYWNYSNTTGKYRNIFLNETIKDTREKIKSGEYKLTDLNGGNIMKKEYILYGLKKDEPEYMEDIMYTSYNKNDMKRVKMLAKKKGYVKFRLSHFIDDGKLPNFNDSKLINLNGNKTVYDF
jgi:hypothetical protein